MNSTLSHLYAQNPLVSSLFVLLVSLPYRQRYIPSSYLRSAQHLSATLLSPPSSLRLKPRQWRRRPKAAARSLRRALMPALSFASRQMHTCRRSLLVQRWTRRRRQFLRLRLHVCQRWYRLAPSARCGRVRRASTTSIPLLFTIPLRRMITMRRLTTPTTLCCTHLARIKLRHRATSSSCRLWLLCRHLTVPAIRHLQWPTLRVPWRLHMVALRMQHDAKAVPIAQRLVLSLQRVGDLPRHRLAEWHAIVH